MTTPHCDFPHLVDELRGVEIVMLSSMDSSIDAIANPSGQLTSRPLVLQEVDIDGCLWFFIGRSSELADDLRLNPQVVISHVDVLEARYMSVSGRAVLVEDPAHASALWQTAYLKWFPLGITDPELLLIRVEAHRAERWLDGAHLRLVSLS